MVSELEETEVNRVAKGKGNPRVKDIPFQAWKKEWHQV